MKNFHPLARVPIRQKIVKILSNYDSVETKNDQEVLAVNRGK